MKKQTLKKQKERDFEEMLLDILESHDAQKVELKVTWRDGDEKTWGRKRK